jgi:hypothetical protein
MAINSEFQEMLRIFDEGKLATEAHTVADAPSA